jgi:hypothetical protein
MTGVTYNFALILPSGKHKIGQRDNGQNISDRRQEMAIKKEGQRDLFGFLRDFPRRRRYRSVPVPQKDPLIPLMPEPSGEMGKLEMAFWDFHAKHPELFQMLYRYAIEWRQARGKDSKLGMKALFERVRWEVSLQSRDELIKLNNNHTAFYARLLMKSDQCLTGLFELRRQRVQSTIGPSNDKLVSAEQIS